MKIFGSKALRFLLVCLAVCGASSTAFASHLRGTSVSWTRTSNPGEVQFTIQYSIRASYGACSISGCPVGSTSQVSFSFGDGSSVNLNATVTAVNTAEDYMSSTVTFNHTYAGPGPYTAFYETCCRVSTIVSGHDDTMRMQTTVMPFGTNNSPVVSAPAILTLPLQATTGFFITASDPDGDTLRYRLANALEQYDTGSYGCFTSQPPGLSVNAVTGQVTWDTTQITAAGCGYAAPQSGDIWTVQFEVSDLDASNNVKSTVPLDIILKFVSSTEAPPTLVLSNPGPITIAAGTPLTFTATGDDTAANSRVTLNTTGLPSGATATNLNNALIPAVVSTFNWTPTAAQVGSYVVTYIATNDTFEQVLASVTIHVILVQNQTIIFGALPGATYGAGPITLTATASSGLPVTYTASGACSVSGNLLTITGAGMCSVTANQAGNSGYNAAPPVTQSFTVAQHAQTIAFTAPATASVNTYITLAATGGASGNPVTYTVTGPATINGNILTITGAGTVVVTANQAGNANYSAAPMVSQTIVTTVTAVVTLSSSSTSFAYGNSANLTACVKLGNGWKGKGTLSIYDGTTLLTTPTTQGDGCVYYYIAPNPSAGVHNYQVFYNDAHNVNVFSNVVAVNVAKGAVTAEVDCWVHDAPYGGNINCDANTDSGPAQGTFLYSYDGGAPVAVATNAQGHALFTVVKPLPGTHTLLITFAATSNYGAFTLPLQTFHVALAPANVALVPSTWYTTVGKSVTLSVTIYSTVKPNAGNVSFYDGATLLGTATVSGVGTSSFTVYNLTLGTHSFTANFSGNPIYANGSAAATVQVGK